MTDQTSTPEAGAAAEDQAQFSLQKLYLKDISFESPSAPMIFQEQGQPDLKLNLAQKVNSVGDDVFEVVLTVTVTNKVGEKTAFLAEVQQAGIFGIKGMEPAQLQATLGSYCPSVLYPYARQVISDLVTHGGFPPLLLQPVNFDHIFAERLRQQQDEAGAVSGTA